MRYCTYCIIVGVVTGITLCFINTLENSLGTLIDSKITDLFIYLNSLSLVDTPDITYTVPESDDPYVEPNTTDIYYI